MPLLLFIAYFVLETLAFWGVVKLIGLGWAIVALFATMFFGMSIAAWEARRQLARRGQAPGKVAGNVGLTIVGGLLLSAPGFVSTLLGLLLILPPTRSLTRQLLGATVMRRVEKAGLRVYQAAPTTSYGTFGGEVIDEEEIKAWSENVSPEDFQKP